ncbi:MAG: helix-turn-helix domain-containing protein [Pseudonocardiaceae bacterium]
MNHLICLKEAYDEQMLKRKSSLRGVAGKQVSGVQTVGHLLTEDAMAAGPSPTVRKRQLGMELRRLRLAAGKTQQDAGDWLGVQATAISKMENAKQGVTQAHLKLLVQLYEVGSPDAESLHKLRSESSQRGWWVEYGTTVPNWFASYVGMETVAAEAWAYESEFIPGLLQTPQYTEAVNIALSPARSSDEIEQIVQLRADRQQRLTGEEPLILRAVINEAALRREVGGPEVMRAQAKQLAEAAKLPNVTVQILPFSAGAHRGMRGAFTALRFPEEPMNTVYVELDGAALYLEAPAQITRYTNTFERLVSVALDVDGTAELLDQIERNP